MEDWDGEDADRGAEIDGVDRMLERPETMLEGAERMLESWPVEMGRVALADPEAEPLAALPSELYTFKPLMLQYASLNAWGLFCT